ncbi:hypothetical protein HPB50_016964 [Hyalomma asiaticum]|uniref:Uncharacterized protein n=1 Tax=Hyalomma asiaticum TaxID=266040 RepID=A0ACB7RNW2_HYAAI|nr:hypothetical protein HPB50_016964 [Hyalomma asiaticum]
MFTEAFKKDMNEFQVSLAYLNETVQCLKSENEKLKTPNSALTNQNAALEERVPDPLDLQKHFGRKKTDPTESSADLLRTGASAAWKSKSCPLQLPRRKPTLGLSEEDYKIVLRPKCPVNLTNIGLVALLEAIYTRIKVDQTQAEQADQVRVHPIKKTITISTPDKARTNAHRTLELLRSEDYSIDMPVSAYVPAPDDSIRGLVYNAYSNETDHDINEEISRKNPQLPIVSARRLGNSRHFVITFAGKDLPSSIRYRCFTLNVYPFRDRAEPCFNCRKLGHRTDVCPQPRPPSPRCRRCGEQHSPPSEGEKPTCAPLCVVCHGQHPTGSRSCKRRFIQPKQTKRTSMTSINITGDTRQQRDKTISGGHNSQHDEPAKHVAWGSGKPHHREINSTASGRSFGDAVRAKAAEGADIDPYKRRTLRIQDQPDCSRRGQPGKAPAKQATTAATGPAGLAMARKPPETPSKPSGDNVSSEASTSDTRQPAGGYQVT